MRKPCTKTRTYTPAPALHFAQTILLRAHASLPPAARLSLSHKEINLIFPAGIYESETSSERLAFEETQEKYAEDRRFYIR